MTISQPKTPSINTISNLIKNLGVFFSFLPSYSKFFHRYENVRNWVKKVGR